jgi:hypothetical protein
MFWAKAEAAMDWTLAIEKNREALKRILAMLVAMVAAANGGSAGGQFTLFPQKGSDASGQAQAEKSKLSPALTLPRHLHRFVLRLLRPAEAAARRLIVIAARGLVVALPPPRLRNTKPKPILNRKNGFGTGVVIRPGPLPEWAQALAPKRSSSLSLSLLDPLKHFGVRRRSVKPGAVPRIWSFDDRQLNPLFSRPHRPDPVLLPPTPDDPLDASRLYRRLEAIGRVLDDLPRQAKRLARWQARRDAVQTNDNDATVAHSKDRFQRLSPMRPGHPPGWRRRSTHEVYGILNELQGLAVWARERPNTS